MKRIGLLTVLLVLITFVSTSCGAKIQSTKSAYNCIPENFIHINNSGITDYLYYDKHTFIVYEIYTTKSGTGETHAIAGYITPYIATNGLPYVYKNGKLTSIKIERLLTDVDTGMNEELEE